MSLSLLSLHSIAAKESAIAWVLFHLKGLEEKIKEDIKKVSDFATNFICDILTHRFSFILFI